MMFYLENDCIYIDKTTKGGSFIKQMVGLEIIIEEIKDENDNIIEIITKKFNLQTGEYDIVE